MISRRKFLQASMGTAFSAAALAAFPPSIRRALAIPANNATGTIADVEHVVILMQENRSFDHYFGTLSGVRGFGDRLTIPMPNGRNVWQQARTNGSLITPYHLNGSANNAQRTAGTPHAWADSQAAWDHGRMSRWPVAKTDTSMGYFKEQEIPFQFALANAFTLCDAYHCSMHTGTDANRAFHISGTNGAMPLNRAFVNNEWDAINGVAADANIGYTWKTYAERLEEAGINWISYQNMPDEWGDNMLGAFQTFRRANLNSGFPVSSGGSPGAPYTNTGQAVPYKAYDAATDNAANPLYKGIANTLPGTQPEQYLDAFRQDIANGKLPQVSWINAPSIYCEHPGPSTPVQGAWFLQEVLDALTANPEVWSKTVLLVNFDENDGYFDHVPSPSAPSRNADSSLAGKTTLADADLAAEYYTQSPPDGSTSQPPRDGRVFGPGPRVPMFVISPWSRGGWVNSQVFDHTSVLRFLETRFGVQEPNISPFRRAVCGDLTSAFNFKTPNSEALPTLAGRGTRASADALRVAQQALPAVPVPSDINLPEQATGTRPSRALPYELHASARAHVNGQVEILFANSGTQAAVFHVYDRNDLNSIPRRYMVEAGKSLSDSWGTSAAAPGQYDLWVLGPNGFHRHFKGDTTVLGGALGVPEVRVCYDIANGDVYVDLMNTGKAACTFRVAPLAYRTDGPWEATVAAGATQTLHWSLKDSGQWYDFAVTTPSDTAYYRRFAGRVETGQHTITDPAMGTV
ncbi:Non-hemolytic phospholipase C [Cupriavidus campinensis]|uniref:phospholipase C n=1 Tax=Cupriavidus campinensis TaxID=151783 RepID=A0ABY3EMZ7_9BURK|nr:MULTISPECIES: phospholipase C, phosphocholine-specific [Cupriavidus]TSP12161.1 phospholipase C, phosphocholine-specific [Cupriavidus campinensis]CAG2129467.1 Non-hemolytic phospholipase C [Cupriavidus campinensis]